jgi:hypothetical protein
VAAAGRQFHNLGACPIKTSLQVLYLWRSADSSLSSTIDTGQLGSIRAEFEAVKGAIVETRCMRTWLAFT